VRGRHDTPGNAQFAREGGRVGDDFRTVRDDVSALRLEDGPLDLPPLLVGIDAERGADEPPDTVEVFRGGVTKGGTASRSRGYLVTATRRDLFARSLRW